MSYPLRLIRACLLHPKYSDSGLTSLLVLVAILSQPLLVYRWQLSPQNGFVPVEQVGLREDPTLRLPAHRSQSVRVDEESRARTMEQYGNLPLSFESATEQNTAGESFFSRQNGFMVSVNSTGALFALQRPGTSADRIKEPHRPDHQRDEASQTSPYDILRMDLVSANDKARVTARKELPGRVNYFVGANPRDWKRDIPTYSAVRYGEVYPGIDLEYYGNGRQLEYDFIVAPGADPRVIRMSYEGVARIIIEKDGSLLLENPSGQLRQERPVVYQMIGAVRKGIPSRYVVNEPRRVSFEIADYDLSKPLVIDPVFVYSTYVGGGSDDIGYAVTMDAAGNAYVAGRTLSTNFPTSGAFRATNSGLRDIFITKLNSSGTSLVYSTYIGGSSDDLAFGVAINSSNEAYLTGWTSSVNFPLANALQPAYGGGGADAFLVKLNAAGNALLASTYAGGSGADVGRRIALDNAQNIYGIGDTNSTDLVTLNAIQSFNAGGIDAFLIKLSPAADSILFSTYAGGSGSDFGNGLAVDSAGSVYAIGDTDSTNLVTVNALQSFNAGGYDAFLAKLTPSGSGIVFATYAGGNGDDSGRAISLDGSANIYAAGYTNSTNLQFIVNAVQPVKGAGYDAFLAKLTTSGTSVVYSTFLGGNNTDAAYAVSTDTAGNAYVTGETASTDFPLITPLKNSNSGAKDVFVTKLNPSGSAILFSTYLGGSANDVAYAIAADELGTVYLTGVTSSANFSASSPLHPTLRGGADAFVSKINTAIAGGPANTVQFTSSSASIGETLNATTRIDIVINRTGNTSGAASIDYATSDGTASERSDYLAALGRLKFDPGQTSKTISVFIVDDRFGETPESFNVNLSTPIGCTFGSPSTITVTINSNESVNGLNPVKDASFDTDFFVRQQYIDFLNRAPDAGGLAFWKNQIDECTTQSCREIRRINVSAAFFVSIEFQETGYLVYKANQAAFNSGEFLKLREFLPDTQEIGRGVVIGQPGADAQLEANKQKFFLDFVLRAKFTEIGNYPTSMTAAQFVDKLNANTFDPRNPGAGALSQTERDMLVAQLAPDPSSPALREQVLRSVSENGLFSTRQFNKAFVLMQYFGYLRRNPNDPPELGLDFGGYNFWLSKLNQFNGNYIEAEMVNAFIVSSEYQQRFGP